MPFDIDAYLANKAAAADKLQAVIDASNQKVTELRAFDAAKQAAVSQPVQKSWSEQLGLNPHGFAGEAVNLGASLVSGASRLAGQVASLPVSAFGAATQEYATQADLDAYNRHVQGQATQADVERLNQRNSPDAPTMWESLEAARNTRDTARKINDATDLTSIVDQTNRQGLSRDLSQTFKPNWEDIHSDDPAKVVSGIAGLLVGTGKAILNNKAAVLEYIAENAPQLAVGAVGKVGQAAMAASNIGYAVDEYQKGIENYAKANNGALPSLEQQHTMALQAASLAVAEEAGDLIGLHGAGALSKEAAKTGFLKSMKNVAKGAAEGFASEAPTEGYQQYMEGQIEGKPQSAEEIFKAAIIGGASGAGLSGGGRALAEITKATPEHAAQRADAAKKVADRTAAIQSGDVSSMVDDPKSDAYAPATAVAALFGHSQQETTTPEQRQANLQKADSIISDLQNNRDALARQLNPEEGKQALETLKTGLASAKTPEDKQLYSELIASAEADLAKQPDGPVAKEMQRRLDKLDAELAKARTARSGLDTLVNPQTDVDAALQTLQDPSKAADHGAAADKIVTLAMTAPDRVDAGTIERIAADTGNGLSPAQRGFLRQFSVARRAHNEAMNTKGVTQEVLIGSRKNVGLAQYANAVGAALGAGNRTSAHGQLLQLQRFARDHAAKAKAAEEALAKGRGYQIYREQSNGGWFVADPGTYTPEERKKNGALEFWPGNEKSEELAAGIAAEADAIAKTLSALRKAYALKFSTPAAAKATAQPSAGAVQENKTTTETTTGANGANDVQNTAREGTGTQAEPQAPTAKDPAAAGASGATTGPNPVSGEGERVGDVQAAGVTEKPAATPARDSHDEATSGSSVNQREDHQSKGTEAASKSDEKSDDKSGDTHMTSENQSTAKDSVEASKEPEQTLSDGVDASSSVTEDTATKSPEGTLEAVGQRADEGAAHNEKQFGDFIEQQAGRESDASVRPLVMVKDFVSKLVDKSVNVRDFLKNKVELTEKQQALLSLFVKAAKKWDKTIRANLPAAKKDAFKHEDMLSFLIQEGEDGRDIEQNVKTAIVAAAFSYVADAAGKSAINRNADINSILGRPEEAYVNKDARRLLGDAVVYQHTLVDSLGTKVVDALGLQLRKDAPKDMIAKLRTALGGQVLKLLEDGDIIKRTTISTNEMAALRKGDSLEGVTPGGEDQHFFALARDDEHQLEGLARTLAEAMRETGNLLQNLFGIENGVRMPSLEPIREQQKASDTGMGIPGLIRKVLRQKQTKEAWRVNKDPMSVLAQFGEDEAMTLEMMGVKTITEQNTHVANERSRQAKNDGLVREFKLFMEFVGEHIQTSEKGLDQEFFLKYDMWKQQRVGIETNGVNPQTSKIQRWLVGSTEWDTTIKLDDEQLMNGFMLRVAEGFGDKTERQLVEAAVAKVKARMQEPVYATAVANLQQVLFNEGAKLTAEQKQEIVTAVNKGGEKLHSLAALIAWARYQQALDTGAGEFTTSLAGEVDGVANGTMLNHVLYGAANNEAELLNTLERGGMYTEQSGVTQYNEYRSKPGARDIYEDTGEEIFRFIRNSVKDGSAAKQVIDAIWQVVGVPMDDSGTVTKAGRDLVKDALNPLNFGAGFSSTLDTMAGKFVEGIYAGFEKLSIAEAPQEAVNDFVKAVNLLLKEGGAAPWREGLSIHDYMGTTFTSKQEKALMKVHLDTVGYATQAVVENRFDTFIERRRQLTDATQLTFELYDAARNAMRQAYIAKLGIPPNKAGEPVHDLTPSQEKEFEASLSAIQPLMDTAMSREDNDIGNGILLAKTDRLRNESPMYTTVVRFGSQLKNGAKQLTARAFTRQQTSPGPLAVSASTHSLDSRISHLTQLGRHILNIHDAVADGIGRLSETAREMNRNTFDTLLDYSPLRAAHVALGRVIQGLAKMQEEGTLTPEALTAIKAVLVGRSAANKSAPSSGSQIPVMLYNTFAAANAADAMKYGVMSKLVSMDQYANAGGNYEVTEADRARAEAKAKELQQEQDKALLEALDTLQKALGFAAAPKAEEKKTETAGVTEPAAPASGESVAGNANTTTTSPFGTLGTGRNNPAITAFFAENPKATAKQVIRFLFKHMEGQPSMPNRDYSAKLLRRLAEILPEDLPVQVVTKGMTAKDVLGHPEKPARGWFVPIQKGVTQQAIYVLGADFAQSAMSTEVLLHEMVHAAITYRLIDPKNAAYKAELESLLEAAKSYAESRKAEITQELKNPSLSKEAMQQLLLEMQTVKAAPILLADVDELIAYGMTNQNFQRFVLAKVQFKSKLLGGLTSGLKALVTMLSRLLGFKTTEDANGLGALLANVAALTQKDEGTPSAKVQATTLSMEAQANDYTTEEVFDALDDNTGAVSPTFQSQLRDLIGSIVDKLHGPFGAFKEEHMTGQAGTAMDVWLKALATGKAPFASQILASPFKVSSQEAFAIEQVEATMLAALNGSETRTKEAYRELAKLYAEVYRTAKASDFHQGDWASATAVEKQLATELYEFVFHVEKSNGDLSNYLARFAALGLAHQGFNQVLQQAGERIESRGRQASDSSSFAERLQRIFENVLDFFRGKITNTYRGQPVDQKLKVLVEQLVDIEYKNRMRLATEGERNSLVQGLEQSIKKGTHKLGEKVEELLNSDMVRNHGNAFLRAAGSMARTVAGNRVDTMLEVISKLRDQELEERHGALMSLVNEAKGPSEAMKFLLLGTKHNEKIRKDIISGVSDTTLSTFEGKGKNLSNDEKAAVSQAFLRSGAHTLLDQFDVKQIEQLLADPKKLQAEIKKFEDQLHAVNPNAQAYWLHQSRALGFYKSTGMVTSEMLLMNAGNIARMVGTSFSGKLTAEQVKQAEQALNPLVSLYALSYLGGEHTANALKVLKAENARTDKGNGVEFVLKLHKRLEQESRDRLFKESPELMIHGYTPEIFNPYTEIQVANEKEGMELIERGWSRGEQVPQDPGDPRNGKRHIYVLHGAGLGARQTGIVSWSNMVNKGSEQHSGFTNPGTHSGLANASFNADMLAYRRGAVKRMFTAGKTFDPTRVGRTFLAPIVNPQGEIVNWRYLMQEQTKDKTLERDNRFEHILGAMAGSIYDKQTSAQQNAKAIQALKDQYDAEFAKESERYIEVSATSPDKELRETWALLPDAARREIRKVWGREGMFVRKDSLDILFGYRKLSAGQMIKDSLDARQRLAAHKLPSTVWDLDPEEFNMLQKLVVHTVETLLSGYARLQGMNQAQADAYAKKASVLITRSGRMWGEVVAEAKDLIVVKTGTVLLDNIWSNLSLLVMRGVPLKDILHHHVVALKGATAYFADSTELRRYKVLLDAGHTLGEEARIKREIVRLEDAIARNPITKLVDAGLMPTIVEDIASEDDIYSWKSELVKKTEGFTSKLPEGLRNIAKTVYMTHDTPLYQGLSRVTQLSDFVARYTLYQHLISRKEDRLSEKEALSQAIDSFIMYDVPMHPLLQYADDTGLFMFTKYFLRIQRVLRALYHDNPARVLAAILLDHTLGLGPIVLDSGAMFRIGNNPLDSGAFKFFGSLDQLATVKLPMSVFK